MCGRCEGSRDESSLSSVRVQSDITSLGKEGGKERERGRLHCGKLYDHVYSIDTCRPALRELTSRFSGLMSLCTMLRLWRYLMALARL